MNYGAVKNSLEEMKRAASLRHSDFVRTGVENGDKQIYAQYLTNCMRRP